MGVSPFPTVVCLLFSHSLCPSYIFIPLFFVLLLTSKYIFFVLVIRVSSIRGLGYTLYSSQTHSYSHLTIWRFPLIKLFLVGKPMYTSRQENPQKKKKTALAPVPPGLKPYSSMSEGTNQSTFHFRWWSFFGQTYSIFPIYKRYTLGWTSFHRNLEQELFPFQELLKPVEYRYYTPYYIIKVPFILLFPVPLEIVTFSLQVLTSFWNPNFPTSYWSLLLIVVKKGGLFERYFFLRPFCF